MGQDYSYTQPSSSDDYDTGFACLLQAEADAESNYNVEEAVQYPAQPECEDGIPKTCYCGADPVVETSYTSKDPGHLYFSCDNAHGEDCHLWKWFDVAVMEELSDIQRQVRFVKDQGFEIKQRLVKVEKILSELVKKKPVVRNGLVIGVCLLGSLMVFIGMVLVAGGWKSETSQEVHGWICLIVHTLF